VKAVAVAVVTVMMAVAAVGTGQKTVARAAAASVPAADSVTATINVGDEPDAVAVNPSGTDAYVADADDDTAVYRGTLYWVDPSLAAGQSVSYRVTLAVGATACCTATIGGVVESRAYDPDLANNAAFTDIQLGPLDPPTA
jgi:DNA-binding beta-propeller fold protein YncE